MMLSPLRNHAVVLACFSCLALASQCQRDVVLSSEETKIKVETVADGIAVPFGMAFLPDGRLLVSDRGARLLYDVDVHSGEKKLVKGLPAMEPDGDEGLLDVLPHPDFANNHLLFLAFASREAKGSTLAVGRFLLTGDSLSQEKRIFTAVPYFERYNFFGSRLLLKNGDLYITTGVSKKYQDSCQRLTNHQGKIMRVREDGSIPADNPYVKVAGALPEIYAIGSRNAQGMTINPFTNEIWFNEHGPKGGDEVNILRPGANYGWPVISFGVDYDGTPVGEGKSQKEGMEQPVYQYTPSIAPSGMEFYTGDAFPMWKGNLFIGGMVLKHLNRLVIKDGKVVHEERLLKELNSRVRNVRQGPDGFLYVGLDGGRIIRLRPAF